VLGRLAAALRPLVPGVARRGTSDLAIGELKFSGNSMRCRRHNFLYHGTLLYDFPLELVGRYLKMPPRQPDYRAGRRHGEFVANLPIDRSTLLRAVTTAWPIEDRLNDVPMPLVAELVASKYGTEPWNR
jgi:lipoate-protein ligase A